VEIFVGKDQVYVTQQPIAPRKDDSY